jgi:glycerol-3-phosphate dehydrogenase
VPVPGSLGPTQRAADIERLKTEHLDVLVIGGGVTGTGCALDAATRGLSVGLVEQRDLASGTSSRSSKLLHGGLRYLEQRDFGLVREALHERDLLMGSLCPHLVRPVSFVVPLTRRLWHRLYYGAGVLLYDLLASFDRRQTLPRHRHLSASGVLELVPGLRTDGLVGGILYHDGQIDDARHTLSVARTASRHGAAMVTSVRVTGLELDEGNVIGARLHDVETGARFTSRARKIVNATGVWSDEIQTMAGRAGLHVRATKGVHIVVARDRIEGTSGVVLRTPESVLFIIPWGRHWLVGTTDTDWDHDLAHPSASRADIDYLLEQANRALRVPLSEADIVGVYAGLRPLIDSAVDVSARISREHAVAEPVPGLVTIAGGKYTTYRVMAADTIDAVVADLDRTLVPRSVTEEIVLIGGDRWDEWSARGAELAALHSLPVDVVERLLWRHGSRIGDVLDLMSEREELAELVPGGGYVAAEIVHAARHEGALHLDDVLARRLRIYMETADRGVRAAPAVAALMATELGWDEARTGAEIDAWQQRVEAERAAGAAPDDHQADVARRSAVDARALGLRSVGPG